MVLKEVFLSSDAHMACIQLAQSTEKEEVICLLFGETTKLSEDDEVAYIYAIKIPHRLDKKKDRVEISVDQLLAGTEYAERLSREHSREIRVLGWFHSHPHITVWPSHVDVRTQANYQTMSSSFVGIICSVFSEDKVTKECEINLTCFQADCVSSDPPRYERRPVPFYVVPNPSHVPIRCLQSICDLPNILLKEEEESFDECATEKTDVLSAIHNEMLLTKKQLHIVNKISIPLLKTLETRERVLRQRLHNIKRFDGYLRKAFGGCD